jgi:hypothetical protein
MPARRDISIYRGDAYTHRVEFPEDFDLTGRTFAAQIKDRADNLLATFDVAIADGDVLLTVDEPASLELPAGVHRWDVQMRSGGVPLTLLAGRCTVTRDVTSNEL